MKTNATIYLPLKLLNVSPVLLFPFKLIFSFIKILFKLALNLVEMVAFVFIGLNILLRLLTGVSNTTLLLLKFTNHGFLMNDFLFQGSNLTVLGHLVLLGSFQSGFKCHNISLKLVSINKYLGFLSIHTGNSIILTTDSPC